MRSAIADYSPYIRTVNSICEKLEAGEDCCDCCLITTNCVYNSIREFCRTTARVPESDPDQAAYSVLSMACAFESLPLGIEAQIGARLKYGPFAPVLVWFDERGMHVFPAPLDQIGERAIGIWRGFASTQELHPLVQARLADLLRICEPDNQRKWGLMAIDAYSQVTARMRIDPEESGFAAKRLESLKAEIAVAERPIAA